MSGDTEQCFSPRTPRPCCRLVTKGTTPPETAPLLSAVSGAQSHLRWTQGRESPPQTCDTGSLSFVQTISRSENRLLLSCG